jgi:hypothetical protein
LLPQARRTAAKLSVSVLPALRDFPDDSAMTTRIVQFALFGQVRRICPPGRSVLWRD